VSTKLEEAAHDVSVGQDFVKGFKTDLGATTFTRIAFSIKTFSIKTQAFRH